MAQNENVAAIERAVEQMNSGNLEGYLELYADDLTVHGYPPEVQGKEGVSAFYASFAKALPDVELTLEDTMGEGDKVAVRYRIRGTHQDELMGVAATGNKVDVDGQSFFRFENGRVVERWQSLDAMTLLAQIDALPAPA
jgi:steroid delta-isomerase-like uncharacterized protein